MVAEAAGAVAREGRKDAVDRRREPRIGGVSAPSGEVRIVELPREAADELRGIATGEQRRNSAHEDRPLAERLDVEAETADPLVRFNDGKNDRFGRFLCGSMGVHADPLGRLYRIGPDDAGTVLATGIRRSIDELRELAADRGRAENGGRGWISRPRRKASA